MNERQLLQIMQVIKECLITKQYNQLKLLHLNTIVALLHYPVVHTKIYNLF